MRDRQIYVNVRGVLSDEFAKPKWLYESHPCRNDEVWQWAFNAIGIGC